MTAPYALHITRQLDNGEYARDVLVQCRTREELLAQLELETRPERQLVGQVSVRFTLNF